MAVIFKMIKIKLIICLVILAIFYSQETYSKDYWELIFQPRQRIVTSIAFYKDFIFIGSGNGVFVSSDEGKSWEDFNNSSLQKDSDGNSYINWISINEETSEVYIATSFGAYYSSLLKPDWKKFFENTKTETNQVNSITLNKDNVYLSTGDGLWFCNIKENICNRMNRGIKPDSTSGNHEVFYVLNKEADMFLAASSGVYFYNDEKEIWEDRSNGIQFLPDGNINARHLLRDKDNKLWLACGTGIYYTGDNGQNWIKKSDGVRKNDVGFQEVYYLSEDENNICVGTGSGVYCLSTDDEYAQWSDITYGLRTKEGAKKVYWLTSVFNKYYAATDEGLFVKDLNEEVAETSHESDLVLKGKIETDFSILEEIEPSVVEVQKQALKFASLPTEKDYNRYRMQARFRNILPMIAVDLNTTGAATDYFEFDRGISTNVLLNNEFDSGKTTRLQRDGKSFKQISVLWNTHNLIFDDAIREILNQARLTANIRENLLDDVTRIYFQRKKLQLNNLISPAENLEENFEKNLEVAELSGQLDSRTGGWFSKEVERRKKIFSESKTDG